MEKQATSHCSIIPSSFFPNKQVTRTEALKMSAVHAIFRKSRHILLYAFFMAILVFALKWLQWKYIVTDYSLDIYMGLIAVFFTAMGVWVATQLTKPATRTIVIEKEVRVVAGENLPDEVELQKLGLSEREYQVLQLITLGHSNAEIAGELFLSLSTIKTHVSNLFVKMEVKSRTQAIEKAKRLRITA
jgi:two-component system, NarL family, response regulator LiaR